MNPPYNFQPRFGGLNEHEVVVDYGQPYQIDYKATLRKQLNAMQQGLSGFKSQEKPPKPKENCQREIDEIRREVQGWSVVIMDIQDNINLLTEKIKSLEAVIDDNLRSKSRAKY